MTDTELLDFYESAIQKMNPPYLIGNEWVDGDKDQGHMIALWNYYFSQIIRSLRNGGKKEYALYYEPTKYAASSLKWSFEKTIRVRRKLEKIGVIRVSIKSPAPGHSIGSIVELLAQEEE